MDMTEKNGQPSMEEILASIRRIIAEEPADAISIDLNAKNAASANAGLDDHSEFELPSMFRPGSGNAQDKSTPLFGRLTDAIRGAAQAAAGDRTVAAVETEVAAAAAQEQAHARGETAPTYPTLSALRTARNETAAQEMRADVTNQARASSAPINPANDPALYFATMANKDVKREMASFMDTRFSGMSAPTNAQPSPIVVQPVAAPPPQNNPGVTDFGSIVPGRLGRPLDPSHSVPPPLNSYQNAATYGNEQASYATPPEGAAAAGGLEDSTAELLRPMLRQWLAENMPRMVEKALHIEVAETVKPVRKPG